MTVSMSEKHLQQQRRGLTGRDQQILEHVFRHRMTTNGVLHKLFLRNRQPNAVTKITSRMCRECLLAKHPLHHPRVYYTLGPRGAQQLGVTSHRTCPLGPQALPTEFGALAYAALGPAYHQRLTTTEVGAHFPWLPEPLLDFPHCLDTSAQPPVLELIRVDLGGTPDHVARKCDGDIQARRQYREFQRLLDEKRFRLVVVTSSSHKAAAIRSALDQHLWPDGLQIHLAVVTQLLFLHARSSDGT